jgi:hypothetical protein
VRYVSGVSDSKIEKEMLFFLRPWARRRPVVPVCGILVGVRFEVVLMIFTGADDKDVEVFFWAGGTGVCHGGRNRNCMGRGG